MMVCLFKSGTRASRQQDVWLACSLRSAASRVPRPVPAGMPAGWSIAAQLKPFASIAPLSPNGNDIQQGWGNRAQEGLSLHRNASPGCVDEGCWRPSSATPGTAIYPQCHL